VSILNRHLFVDDLIHKQGRIWGALQPPTADASMENGEGEGEEVVEERRKMERKRGRRRNQPLLSLMKVLSLEFRKETSDTRQRSKTKVEPAIKFSPP
jgi:hypothetical protein